jgi:hypothetical protein
MVFGQAQPHKNPVAVHYALAAPAAVMAMEWQLAA